MTTKPSVVEIGQKVIETELMVLFLVLLHNKAMVVTGKGMRVHRRPIKDEWRCSDSGGIFTF